MKSSERIRRVGHVGRIIVAAFFQAMLLGTAGCHKQRTTAYQPPASTAPTIGRDSTGRTATGRTATGRSADLSKPPTTKSASPAAAGAAPAQPTPRGKPVSTEVGLASWYGPPYNSRKGADGTVYDQNAMTAAHKTLPMGSLVKVTNLANDQSVVVRITDRGPFVGDRIIDLSLAAARATGVYRAGIAKVRVEAYAPPQKPGTDPAGRWCVQIGAFLDPDDAIQLKNDLSRRYARSKVVEFAGPTGHWVRIDPQRPDKATATQVADSIHIPDPGVQPYVVRLN